VAFQRKLISVSRSLPSVRNTRLARAVASEIEPYLPRARRRHLIGAAKELPRVLLPLADIVCVEIVPQRNLILTQSSKKQ
jgi:hypothetical protein